MVCVPIWVPLATIGVVLILAVVVVVLDSRVHQQEKYIKRLWKE